MTFTSKRFEVKANPWAGVGDNSNISNLSDSGALPDDDQKLKWMYNQYGPKATFDPNTKQFFPATLNYGQNEIDSAPGDTFNEGGDGGEPFQVPIPRISPIDEGQFSNSNGCPSGFYQFGKVCVPDASLNPDSPGSELGVGGNPLNKYYGNGPAKGIITAITPPQFTQPNQEFIVITDMQNIGGEPAKFYTQISIPELNLTASTSNSSIVNPLQRMKIGHRIIMPATISASTSTLLTANVQLGRIPLTGTGTPNQTSIFDDTGKVSIPAPGYRGPLPPGGGGGMMAGTIASGQGLYPGAPPFTPIPPPQYPPRPRFYPPPPPPFRAFVGFETDPKTKFQQQLQILPFKTKYTDGDVVRIVSTGYQKGEHVSIQVYDVVNLQGTLSYGTRLVNKVYIANKAGSIDGHIKLSSNGSKKIAVVVLGNASLKKVQTLLNIGF